MKNEEIIIDVWRKEKKEMIKYGVEWHERIILNYTVPIRIQFLKRLLKENNAGLFSHLSSKYRRIYSVNFK